MDKYFCTKLMTIAETVSVIVICICLAQTLLSPQKIRNKSIKVPAFQTACQVKVINEEDQVYEDPVYEEPEHIAYPERVAYPERIETKSSQVSEPYTGFVQYEPGTLLDIVRNTQREYEKVPENIRNNFENSGWNITVANSSIAGRFGYGYPIQALIRYGDKVIWIDNRYIASTAIVHEMGHYIDYSLGFISSRPEFITIYAEEVPKFCAYHSTHENNTNSASEYFAESFQQYVLDPVGLATACPKTFIFIQNCVNSL